MATRGPESRSLRALPELPNWPDVKIAGRVYGLRHLNGIVKKVRLPAPGGGSPFRAVRVVFGCHCFTRAPQDEDRPDIRRRWGPANEDRTFDVQRHALSLHLPTMVDRIIGGEVVPVPNYAGRHQHYAFQTNIPISGTWLPYSAFLTLARAQNERFDAVMIVRSAYSTPPNATVGAPILFAALLESVIRR